MEIRKRHGLHLRGGRRLPVCWCRAICQWCGSARPRVAYEGRPIALLH